MPSTADAPSAAIQNIPHYEPDGTPPSGLFCKLYFRCVLNIGKYANSTGEKHNTLCRNITNNQRHTLRNFLRKGEN
nr:MAG TPA: hypothetical protein [Caudoviricetes sp.]